MQFRIKGITAALVASGVLLGSNLAHASDSDEIEKLRALVQELDQKIRVLDRKGEIAEEDAAAKKKETPVVKASKDGFGFESADGQNSIKFRAVLQTDYRYYDQGANDIRERTDGRAGNIGTDGFHNADDTYILRRARPIIEGTLFGKYDYRFTPDFGSGTALVQDAYVDGKFAPGFKVRVGKFKPDLGLERLQSAADTKFVERSYVTNDLLPNRDIGIALHGDILDDKLNYSIGYYNGVADGSSSSGGVGFLGDKDVGGRIFATPFKGDDSALAGLGFGIAATYGDAQGERNLNFTDTTTADNTRQGLPAAYLTDGQQVFFRYGTGTVADGSRFRIAPQANYYYGPFGLIAEYAQVEQEVSLAGGGSPAGGGAATNSTIFTGTNKKLTHDAWEVAASYLLTGEDASFKGVKPKRDFDLNKGGWGAWELVARYSEINLDSDTFKNRNGQYAVASSGTTANSAYADLSQSAKAAQTWAAGVNWYLNQNVKFQLNYEETSFDGGAITGASHTSPGGAVINVKADGSNIKDREDERAIFARVQLTY
ncbi:MAG TPA: porin [Methylophilaceae bacterium]|jgi:phosphate-selective porin OprO/OprP